MPRRRISAVILDRLRETRTTTVAEVVRDRRVADTDVQSHDDDREAETESQYSSYASPWKFNDGWIYRIKENT